jgi:pimeloyl-ACP methyl ester carboxylesterase
MRGIRTSSNTDLRRGELRPRDRAAPQPDRARTEKFTMKTAISKDGTSIAYDQLGEGPPLILVGGALNTRSFGPNGSVAPLLAERFTVINYDRRGRGASGDTRPWTLEREVEDLDALIEAAGGSAYLFGISSGAALALEAASHGLAIEKLALYEAPFIVDDSRPPLADDYLVRIQELAASDRPADAIRLFMKEGVGLPAVVVALMRFMPAWSKLKAVAHTLPYDAAIVYDYQKGRPLPPQQWSSATMPTLVSAGGKSPDGMRNAMRELAEKLPNATYHTLEGQTHIVKAEALAPVLVEFFDN